MIRSGKERQARASECRFGKSKGLFVNDRGFVVLIIMVIITALTLIGLATNRNAITDIGIAANHASSLRTFYAAEGAATQAFSQLWGSLQTLGQPIPNPTNPSIAGFTFVSNIEPVPAAGLVSLQRPATGDFAGLTAFVQKYRITSTATENNTNARSTVSVDVEDQLIPIFQFGVFYDQILEILPGANMTIDGRIHSNHSIHMGSNNTLRVNSRITTARDIFNNRLDSGDSVGNPYIHKEGAGTDFNETNYPRLGQDSNEEGWLTYKDRWNGGIRTTNEGVKTVKVPMPTDNAIDIIGTGTGSMYQSAGLKIINGVGYDGAGNNLDWCTSDPNYKKGENFIIDPGCDATKNVNPVVKENTLYDYREGTTMRTLDVNIEALQNLQSAMTSLKNPPTGADAGILYVSSSDTNGAVRLVNGSVLPQDQINGHTMGLTVATDNPVYVKGNYNSSGTVPAAIISDAITILSNSWSDSYGSSTGINGRVASETTVNTAIMSGNRNTSGSNYSGGLENFMRFLENWSGVDYNYNGSIVCLWQSNKVTHKWPGTGVIYNPPNRNWGFAGFNANNLPPGTPRVRVINRIAWNSN
jgi:hypothetical protein